MAIQQAMMRSKTKLWRQFECMNCPRTECLQIATEDRGPRTEDRGPRTEDRGPRTEDGDGGPRTMDGRLVLQYSTTLAQDDLILVVDSKLHSPSTHNKVSQQNVANSSI